MSPVIQRLPRALARLIRARSLHWLKLLAIGIGLVLTGVALLPQPVSAQSEKKVPAALYRAVEDYLGTQTRGLPGKVSFRIVPLEARTQLAPCDAFEPFQPAGTTPWGKTTVGVRCLGPATWTVYVQAQIRVLAKYLVAARHLTAGQNIGEADIVSREGDLGSLPATVLFDADQAVGRTVKISVAAGQPLRSEQLVAAWAVQNGQTVKTVSQGTGFSVSSDGRALNNAMEGQVVQVRTSSGQTVSGIARQGGIVEINY